MFLLRQNLGLSFPMQRDTVSRSLDVMSDEGCCGIPSLVVMDVLGCCGVQSLVVVAVL